MAQNVYSLNVVGYVQITLTNKFNLVANQLDLDGTGINNTVTNVFGTNLPPTTKVFAFNPATQTYFNTATYINNGAWVNPTTPTPGLQPGAGVWVQLPAGQGTPTPITLTLVGTVFQGNKALSIVGAASPKKFQFMSLVPPISVGIETGTFSTGQPASYPAATGDAVYFWNSVSQSYLSTKTRTATVGNWINGEPVPAIGQAFFLASTGNKTWNQNFTVP